jgi:hypothetical protein
MNKLRVFLIFAVALLLVAGSTTAWAAPPKDSLVVVAGTSGNGTVPFIHGSVPEWFYVYPCVASGSSFSDTIPVTFTLNGSFINAGTGTASISFNVNGNPALTSAVSVSPSPVSVTEAGGTNSVTITIGPVSLADGNYTANVQMSAAGQKVTIDHDTIHIHVRVGGCGGGEPADCFITDSSFNPLLDCSGLPVAIDSNGGGTFQIVANNKKIAATNPGQFYYNEIWTNPSAVDGGVAHNITLTMSKSDATLVTNGTNALHVLVFQSGDIDPTHPLVAQFNEVNSNGTPCGTGTTGPTACKVTVTIQPGQIIFVTWHLAYAKIGQPAANAGYPANNKCPGTEVISATGIISDTDTGDVLATCTATATGYFLK